MGGGDAGAVEGFRREFDRLYIQPQVAAREQFNLPYNPAHEQFNLPYNRDLMANMEAVRKVRRVYVGGLPPSANEQIHVSGVGSLPTKVVCLIQVVTADELQDDEEYEDIMEDMRLEACRYGNLVKVVIPRPDPSGQPVAGVGKVFLEYAYIDNAAEAKTMLHGRKFSGNPVAAVYYPEDKFANGEYDG